LASKSGSRNDHPRATGDFGRGDVSLPTMSRTRWTIALSLIALATAPRSSRAQAAADVDSIGGILRAAYDVISGPAGQRDWQRFNTLFAPDARLIQTQRDTSSPTAHLMSMTPDDFAKRAGDYFSAHSFYEREIGRTVNTFGAVTQVFDAYASRHEANDAKPFARGINSFQLFNDGKRWYIVTIYWDDERSGNTIPGRYLRTGQ
jgi:hypothetical protein